jgi:hypothetical protein
MWAGEIRAEYDRHDLHYPSDLVDADTRTTAAATGRDWAGIGPGRCAN